jgi:peptidoglycan/LPS O-acetylase OafA/YrhL
MSQVRNSGSYFSVLDGIRGIAAALILVRHTTIFFGVRYPESFLAVDLFFALSGVVIASAYERRLLEGLGRMRFAWLRIVRIYPLYILGTFFGIVGVLAGRPFAGDMSTALLLSFLLIPYLTYGSPFPFNGVSWSLFYEIVANLIYATFVRFLTTSVVLLIMTASAFGLATIFLEPGGLDVGWEQQTFFGGVLRVGYSFFAGIFLYRQYEKNKSKGVGSGYGTVLSILVIAFVASLLMAKPSEATRPFYEITVVLIIFPAVVYVAMSLEPIAGISTAFKFLGMVSYGIYTLHSPLSAFVRGAMLRTAGISNAVTYPSAPWFGVGFIVSMALLCWLADRFYDAPIRRFLLKLSSLSKSHTSARIEPTPTVSVEEETPASQAY